MSAQQSVVDLMARLHSGEDSAARELFARFTARLIGLARGHLGGMLARKVEPEDIVQSAYKSFLVRQQQEQRPVDSWDSLWGLLAVITLRKCADKADYFAAAKRDLAREAGGESWQAAVDREPGPEEAVMLADTVRGLFAMIDDVDERAILELSLQGHSAAEISETTGRAERSVRRLREKIRRQLEAEAAIGAAP